MLRLSDGDVKSQIVLHGPVTSVRRTSRNTRTPWSRATTKAKPAAAALHFAANCKPSPKRSKVRWIGVYALQSQQTAEANAATASTTPSFGSIDANNRFIAVSMFVGAKESRIGQTIHGKAAPQDSPDRLVLVQRLRRHFTGQPRPSSGQSL